MIVFEAVYERFKQLFVEKINQLKVGAADEDDFGPVINQEQLDNMLAVVEPARQQGGVVLTGGFQMKDAAHRRLLPGAHPGRERRPGHRVSRKELFGPVTCLYCVNDFKEALALANDTSYGLTACIHTHGLTAPCSFARKSAPGWWRSTAPRWLEPPCPLAV